MMLRRGQAPFLECSSKGDKRFSAFYARVNGRSIEDQYQAAKVFEDGRTGLDWREAKGRKAVNQEEVAKLYTDLWRQYLKENPELQMVLWQAEGLSDIFGKEGSVCQADVLWQLRKELFPHFPSCTHKYPEKPTGEEPQPLIRIELSDGTVIRQCGDCGQIVTLAAPLRGFHGVFLDQS